MSAGQANRGMDSAQSVIEPVTNERRGWSNWPTIQRRACLGARKITLATGLQSYV